MSIRQVSLRRGWPTSLLLLLQLLLLLLL